MRTAAAESRSSSALALSRASSESPTRSRKRTSGGDVCSPHFREPVVPPFVSLTPPALAGRGAEARRASASRPCPPPRRVATRTCGAGLDASTSTVIFAASRIFCGLPAWSSTTSSDAATGGGGESEPGRYSGGERDGTRELAMQRSLPALATDPGRPSRSRQGSAGGRCLGEGAATQPGPARPRSRSRSSRGGWWSSTRRRRCSASRTRPSPSRRSSSRGGARG